jgi:hypothetical protein
MNNFIYEFIFKINMKHIGWCLDRIQTEMMTMPKAVILPKDKERANQVLNEIQKYANTLAELILHPKFKKSLNQLENSPIEGVRLQAQEIEELFKDLEHMLLVLDYYLKDLREIIKSQPKRWSKKADRLVLMIDQKFGGERGELREEFKIALHKKEELKQFITSEEHLAEFLK